MNRAHSFFPAFRVLAACLSLILLSRAHAASFDCSKAGTPVEKMICADPALSTLDSELGQTYIQKMHESAQAAQLREQELKWMRDVRNKCTTPSCLEAAYKLRLAELRGSGMGAANAEEGSHSGQTPLKPGKYCRENGELDISSAKGGELTFDLNAVTVLNASTGAVNTGDISGSIEPTASGGRYIDKSADCILTFQYSASGIGVTQKGSCGFGVGVDASGAYSTSKCSKSKASPSQQPPAAVTSNPNDQLLAKYREEIEGLGLDNKFLRGEVYVQEDLVNRPQKLTTLERLIALIMANPKVKKVAGISYQKTEGFTVKIEGQRTVGILFTNDDGDLFPQYLSDDQQDVTPLENVGDQYQVTLLLLHFIGQ